jgi:hypothetical protein
MNLSRVATYPLPSGSHPKHTITLARPERQRAREAHKKADSLLPLLLLRRLLALDHLLDVLLLLNDVNHISVASSLSVSVLLSEHGED